MGLFHKILISVYFFQGLVLQSVKVWCPLRLSKVGTKEMDME